jgi:hypothetical protein
MAISLIDRWNSDTTGEQISICINCKNYLKGLTCKAFPEGIPEEILNGDNNHSKPLPDQENDIVFESK